jgi:fumarylacetoacetase
MTPTLNETHDPGLTSWVETADDPGTGFPLQNLPYCSFTPPGESARCIGVGIGEAVLDVAACGAEGLLEGAARAAALACRTGRLNDLMALPPADWSALRLGLSRLLRTGAPAADRVQALLTPQRAAVFHLPAEIGDYTDFYASVHHATNVGSMFRPDQPLLPNYKHVPIGYHGRASSIVVSGTPVRRPAGQRMPDDAAAPVFGPSTLLDYELEMGLFVGNGTSLGEPSTMERFREHAFGLCLLNDWSARDIQKWEYQPLGPFLAKNFGTTISPWVVTLEAIAPFRVAPPVRPEGDPEPLPYLRSPVDAQAGGFDVVLEVRLSSDAMRRRGDAPVLLSRGNLRDMYWTFAQMLTHHASNGCNLRPGDLLGSGTVSGPDPGSRGCLLELTWRGRDPIRLPDGELRRFLQDGDEVVLSGRCVREGFRSIGFGECAGTVLPALF